MSILTLELSQNLEHRLTSEARRLGLSLEQYVLRLLGGSSKVEVRPRSGAEVVEFWRRHGVIGSRPEIEDPAVHAREIRRQAERRIRH